MGLLKEFKEFAVKGNAIDMAVGIIIGAAFGKIVTSLVLLYRLSSHCYPYGRQAVKFFPMIKSCGLFASSNFIFEVT